MKAVRNHKSLLPSGIISVKGSFEAGDVVMLNDKAKAVTNFSSSQLKQIAGKHSSEIAKILAPATGTSSQSPKTLFFLITEQKIDNFRLNNQ